MRIQHLFIVLDSAHYTATQHKAPTFPKNIYDNEIKIF